MVEGRIVKGVGGLYTVSTKDDVYECSVRGVFRNRNINPTIGDFVVIEVLDEVKKKGNIEDIKERKNFLLRPRVSNIDQAIIVFSLVSPKINLDLLDKFLITAEHENINAILCLNKIDLTEESEYKKIMILYQKAGYEVVCVSALNNKGQEELKSLLENKVSVFAGPSGVGKSSIINNILPNAKMETGELSLKIQRGKHTTRHSQLMEMDKNSFIVDSPGFTTLNIENIPRGELAQYFREFGEYFDQCSFSDCMHINEPNCGVKENVGANISLERYGNYVKIWKGCSHV